MDCLYLLHNSFLTIVVVMWMITTSDYVECMEVPRIQPFQFPQNIQMGDKTTVLCTVMRDQATTSYEWYKDARPLKSSKNINIETSNMFSTLMINPIEDTSLGNYTCTAKNEYGHDSVSAFLYVKAPPFWIKEGVNTEVIEGQNINITCSAGGFPIPNISIKKEEDNSIVVLTTGTIRQSVASADLSFHPVLKIHDGTYVCEAENGVGKPIRNSIAILVYVMSVRVKQLRLWKKLVLWKLLLLLQIIGSHGKILPFNFPQKVHEGESTKVVCTVMDEDKSFTFKWLKNGLPINNDNKFEISALDEVSLLKIKLVSSLDSGNYTCVARTSKNILNYTAPLLVEAPVQWLKEPVDVEVVLGESAKFFCSVRGFPTPVTKWTKISGVEEYEILRSDRINLESGYLLIKNVKIDDKAYYVCSSNNGVGESLEKKVSLSVIAAYCNDAPEILPFQVSTKLKIGDTANLFCSVIRGQVPLTFKWYKNGISFSDKSREITSNEKFSNLVIDPVTASSGGNYTCVVSNSFGESSYSAVLLVRAPPFWITEPVDVESVEGRNVNLICKAGGTPQPKIHWKKLNSHNEEPTVDEFRISNGTLSLTPVLKYNEGVYICQVNNEVGEVLEKKANVVVHDTPKVFPFIFPQTVQVQEKVSVACMVKQGSPPLRFSWLKNRNELTDTNRIKIKTSEDMCVLTIEPVMSTDSGNYTCSVSNKLGRDTFSAKLIVNAPPRWLVEPFDIEVLEGNSASLLCQIESLPPPVYVWKKTEGVGELLLKNKKEGNLTFPHIRVENAGKYTCEAGNGIGDILQKTVNIVVQGGSRSKGIPPKIQPFSVSDQLTEGKPTKLGCVVSEGSSPRTFTWYKNGKEVKHDSEFEIHNTEDVSFLTVLKLSGYSSGNFTCKVRNSAGEDSYSVSLIVKALPRWITEPGDLEELLGNSVSIECFATGYPTPTIKWSKITDTEDKATILPSKNGTLRFNPLLSEDEGKYLCVAGNNVGVDLEKIVTLSVLESASDASKDGSPQVAPFIFPPRLSEGASIKVICNIVHGKKPVDLQWFKDGTALQEKKDHKQISKQEDFSILTMSNIRSDDAGNYTCKAKNVIGASRFTAKLVVEAPPVWQHNPHDTTGVYGSRLHLYCAAAGSPHPTITWYKGGDVILPDAPRAVAPGNGSLLIHILNEEDEGIYRCTAHNGVGETLEKEIKIVVNVPARFEEKFTVLTVKKGDSASLKCEAVGDQPLSIIWKKDGKEQRKINGGRYEIFETLTPKGLKSELVLREADRIDGQLYTCSTENPYGKDERSIKLLVMEVPATPLDLKVQEIWSRSASVTWSSPYTGNSPITKYVLQYWRDAVSGGRHRLEEKVVSSAQTSALIKDLHPGVNYGLAIVAENTVGRGEPSDTVSFSTGEEEPSGSPMDVNVDIKGAASLLVTWKPPPKNEWNGKLRGYYVGYKIMHDSVHPYSFKTVDYVPGGVQEHMLTSLRKDTEYSIIVRAFNSAGSGPPSQDVIVRTLGGDLPAPPIVFVVATTETSIKIQWRSPDTKNPLSGHAIHYRKKGEGWQRVAVTSPLESSYTVTGLHSGAFYQLYVTANSDYGEGDPSDIVTVKTYEQSNVVLLAGSSGSSDHVPLLTDVSLLIPVAASLLAVTLVIIVVCIWVLKAKSRRNLERAIQEDKRYIYAAATQRYVDIDKTRSLPAYHDPSLLHYPTPYATVLMGDEGSEGDPNQEMRQFIPQNMKDRPLPKPGTLKKGQRDSHIYDSAE
ncbi:hypothetical protein JTE90_017451 [Oedothorax gibbosus]|uniref:Down syndrome cell adhesion molecule-like protein Dscam2 n=1 Tax=Oedothorax gibbosus TaxID=931172 RepID=A0AAV6U2B0_9ARAC|nr:hypothetical protein JTE90_017451 [Oedothorax gibbosus]